VRLTVHLYRDDVGLDPSALLDLPDGTVLAEPVVDPGFRCYAAGVFRGSSRPEWADYLDPYFGLAWQPLVSTSVVLLVAVRGRWLALTFGRAATLVRRELLEPDFGIRSTANTLARDGLLSATTVAFSELARHTTQRLSVAGTRSAFTVDFENEWTKTLAGSTGDDLTRAMSGSQSLQVQTTAGHRLQDLEALLAYLLDRYRATDYQRTFAFIDRFAPLPRTDLICDELDRVVERFLLNPGRERVVVVAPEHPGGPGLTHRLKGHSEELDLDQLTSEARRRPRALDLRVVSRTSDGVDLPGTTPIRMFLSAEVSRGDGHYVLSDGFWFRIERDFARELADFLAGIDVVTLRGLPRWYKSWEEKDYNDETADRLGWLKLDRVLYPGPDRRHGQIEVADLVTPSMDFVCVKRMKRSAGLSHLFAQGSVSARLYRESEPYREFADSAIRRHWPRQGRIAPRFVYAIGLDRRRALPEGLPFFSRVHLRTHVQEIRRHGFDVALTAIPITALPPNLSPYTERRPARPEERGDPELRLF
jgi:uncharacterized protein (TIGR04141 family)